jgi:hypothetical protein
LTTATAIEVLSIAASLRMYVGVLAAARTPRQRPDQARIAELERDLFGMDEAS